MELLLNKFPAMIQLLCLNELKTIWIKEQSFRVADIIMKQKEIREKANMAIHLRKKNIAFTVFITNLALFKKSS